MPWDPSRWDRAVLDAYRELGALRRASRALRHGGLRWVHAGADVLVFLREARDERVLVQVARRDHEPVVVAGLDGTVGAPLFGGGEVVARGDGTVELPAGGTGIRVWALS
jgi:alpha-glucosidase